MNTKTILCIAVAIIVLLIIIRLITNEGKLMEQYKNPCDTYTLALANCNNSINDPILYGKCMDTVNSSYSDCQNNSIII